MTQGTTQGEIQRKIWNNMPVCECCSNAVNECTEDKPCDHCSYSIEFVERELTKARLENHANISYSPYVDMFQYYDSCAMTMDKGDFNKYIVTKEIRFWSDKDGNIMLLDIPNLHSGATLTTQLKKGE